MPAFLVVGRIAGRFGCAALRGTDASSSGSGEHGHGARHLHQPSRATLDPLC